MPMPTVKVTTAQLLVMASAFLSAPMVAEAGSPIALTNSQLDRVTAAQGGPFAEANAAATGAGLLASGNTGTIAVTGVGNSPFHGSDAYASGVAVGTGSNGLTQGEASTAVTTFSEAPGNFVVNMGYNTTIFGLGTTVQVGVSVSTGDLVPGLP